MVSNVTYLKGNIFTSGAQTIVNTVNLDGVMGAGIALECRYRYPEMFTRYSELCEKNQLQIGTLYLFKSSKRWILNFPTKKHWKHPSKEEYLELGLAKFLATYQEKGISSIAFPMLGAQNGGLDPEQSAAIMDDYLSRIPIPVEIWEFDPAAPDDLLARFKHLLETLDIGYVSEKSGLKRGQVEKLIELLTRKRLKSMGQLIQERGIGEVTAEKCYAFAMQEELGNIQLNIFQ